MTDSRNEHRESPVTVALRATEAGDPDAAAELLPLIYEELRKLAQAKLRSESPGHTLQPTALVHEAYVKVVGEGEKSWGGRGHFFSVAALAMRRILVDQARKKASLKRGGARDRVDLDDVEVAFEPPPGNVLGVDEALQKLEAIDPRKGQIVNLRYFSGMSVPETAAALDLSVSTIEHEWRYIRAWLQREVADD
jgi:RNA polymerase sigma factor (TIGR02999 family)